jgi:hypothetical protein
MSGAEGAYYNVLINLDSLQELDQSAEPDFMTRTQERASAALSRCEQLATATRQSVRQKLETALD